MRTTVLALLLAPAALAQAPPPDTLAARWARAVEAADAPAVEALLAWGPAPEMPGDPPLYLAARSGRTAFVARLLEAGADPETASALRGTRALDAAVFYGHADVARRLLEAGADPLRRGPIGFAALDWALEAERPAMIALVLDVLADGAEGAEASTYALARAVTDRDAGAVGRLLAAGAAPDGRNGARYAPVALAARFGAAGILDALLEAGADPDAGDVGLDEASPLHQAARGGSAEAAARLLDAGADPNKLNARGFTALHLAALYGRPAVAAALLEAGTDPHVRSVDPDPAIGEYTAFDFAVEQGAPAVADTLLAWAARGLDAAGFDGAADRLARAALRGDAAAVRRGLETDPDAPATYGTTPLALAARFGRVEALRALLEAGADPDRRGPDRYGATPLMQAARAGSLEALDTLLEAGAHVDARDRYGSTALVWAAQGGSAEAAERLLGAGADRSARGRGRRTAADVARARGDLTLAARLDPGG